MATRKLYTIKQGEPLRLLIPLLVDGVATAVAGWSPWLAVKRDALQSDDDAIAQLTLGDGITVYDATNWVAVIPASATKTQAPGALIYEIEATDPATTPYPLEEGDILLNSEINQAA